MITRREMMIALGAGALFPPAAFAQQRPKIRRIGVLSHAARPEQLEGSFHGAFLSGLRELGHIEGKNLVIEERFANNQMERLPDLAADLVRMNVEVIVSHSTVTTQALHKATSTIPIVMSAIADPVGRGFVKSLARPGGNITGLTNMVFELRGKQLEMLRSINPKLTRVAALYNPDSSANIEGIAIFQAAAKKFGIEVISLDARTPQKIDGTFARIAKESIQAILLIVDPAVFPHRGKIAESAVKLKLPSIGSDPRDAEAGVLMSYGPNFIDIARRAATYVDKILKGTNPADLPVEQPMRIDLVVNMKTAKALGIKLPDEIMVRAERFIE
jgi:putative ABC transport system substrate-binding protein